MSLALVVAVAAALAIATAAESKTRTGACAKRGSHTVVETADVRVYEVDVTTATTDASVLYGCRFATRKPLRLDTSGGDGYSITDTYDRVRVRGTQVAWVSTVTDQSCKADCPPGAGMPVEKLAVADLKTRKTRTVPAAPLGHAIVLSPSGALAWAAAGNAPGVVAVHASVSGTDDRVLDSGAIDPSTLAIEITIVSWTRDGVEHFARLR